MVSALVICTQGHVVSEIENPPSSAEASGLQPFCGSLSKRIKSLPSVSFSIKPAAVSELSYQEFLIRLLIMQGCD